MSNRLFQGLVHQMRDTIDATIGVVDETATIIACSVKNAETEQLRDARILLSVAVRQVLRNTLEILNIDRPEKM